MRRAVLLVAVVGLIGAMAPVALESAEADPGRDQTVHARGAADFLGSPAVDPDPNFVGIAGVPDGTGYWLVTADGRVMHYGSARWYGSLKGEPIKSPIAGVVATPTGRGYWLFAQNGRVYAFGDAPRRGSAVDLTDVPITAMATTPSGDGYWLLNARGRVFDFGDARWRGALRDIPFDGYAMGIAATPSGGGYWITSTAGGVFSFGDAVFHGSLGGSPPKVPVIAIARTPSGDGYWLAGADGALYAFGGAADRGGAYAFAEDRRVVGFAATTSGADGYWFVVQPKPPNFLLLGPGSSGRRVTQLQRRLLDLGYWVTIDGQYGPLTQQAVYAFQKYERLPRTGSITVGTNQRLIAAERPRARSTTGNLTELDIARQIIFIVRGGRVQWVFNTSTGTETPYTFEGETSIAHTSRGRFVIQRHIDGLRISRLGQLWRPKYWDGGIAFHGSRSIPPYPASHGCARLSYPAMDYVWSANLMPIGSAVWSY